MGRRRRGYHRLHPVQIGLIGFVSLLTITYGTYHVTTEGTWSGTLELIAFVMILVALFSPQESHRTFRGFTWFQVVLLSVVAIMALGFGIYHVTTPDGLRSGILELTSFFLLVLSLLLPFPSQKNFKDTYNSST